MKKIYLFVILSLPVNISLFAQTDSTKTDSSRVFTVNADEYKKYLPNYSPLSPNSASFQKFGDYSVNMATGVPDISIPLYTVQQGGLSLPIVIRYHASGHRIDELASRVGWGWSLEAGGAVNRSIQGIADDRPISLNYLRNPIIDRDLCDSNIDYSFLSSVEQGNADTQPDVLSYQAPSISGKFMLRHHNESPFLIPWQAQGVNYDTAANGTITAFSILNEQGQEFRFGKYANATEVNEYQSVRTIANDPWQGSGISSWPLTQMLSPNTDDQIELFYQSGDTISQVSNSYSATINYDVSGNPTSYTILPHTSTQTRLNSTQNIQKISYTNGEVEFIESSGFRADMLHSRSLDSIKVYHYENGVKQLLKTFTFHYSYFTDRLNNDGRLRLDSLRMLDQASQEIETYKFDYTTTSYSWLYQQGGGFDMSDLPKVDYFNYYNGQNNAHTLDATYNGVSWQGGSANRSSNETYIKQATLNRITYPTGGYSVFDFEANKIIRNSSTHTAGGLRIKSIKNYLAGGGLENLRRYEYSSNDGAGIGKLTTGSWSFPARGIVGTFQYVSGTNILSTDIIGASANTEGNPFDSAPVYYTSVKVFDEESADPVKNGRTEYTFGFDPDLIVTGPLTIDTSYNTFQREIEPWKRGQELSRKIYDNTDSLIYSKTTSYQNYKTQSIVNMQVVFKINNANKECNTCSSSMLYGFTLPGSRVAFGLSGTPCSDPELKYGKASHRTGALKPVQVIETKDGLSSTSIFSYDDHLLPDTTTTVFNYLAKERQMISLYPTHSSYAGDAVADSMVSRNMISIPLEQMESESFGGSPSNFFRRKNVYGLFTGANTRGLTNNLLPKETWIDLLGNTLEKRVDFIQYDTDGNLLEYQVDGIPTALAYGYQNELLIGKAENTTRSALSSALAFAGVSESDFETTVLNTTQRNALSAIRTSLGNSRPLTWYTHLPMVGVSQILSPKGLIQSFEYDTFQRLERTKVNDGSVDDRFSYTYADGGSIPAVPSALAWDTQRNSCSNSSGTNCTFQVFVTGIGSNASVEFSIDGSNWQAPNLGNDGFQVSIPYVSGGSQNFWARPSDNPTGGVIFGTLGLCDSAAGPPDPPVISVTATSLCSVTLSASGCSGTVNWSNSSSGTSINVPTVSSTGYTATCTTAGGTSSNSNSLSVPVLPSGWTATDVGSPSGSCTQESSGDWTLKSDGSIGAAGANDDFHYVYQQITGDFTMTVKLADITSTSGDRSGIMIRNSLDPKAIDFTIFQDGNAFGGLFWRTAQGGDNEFKGFVELVIDQTWLRVQRVGGNLYYYYSTDGGSTWNHNMSLSPAHPVALSLSSTLYVGLATWGGLHETTFNNLQITTP